MGKAGTRVQNVWQFPWRGRAHRLRFLSPGGTALSKSPVQKAWPPAQAEQLGSTRDASKSRRLKVCWDFAVYVSYLYRRSCLSFSVLSYTSMLAPLPRPAVTGPASSGGPTMWSPSQLEACSSRTVHKAPFPLRHCSLSWRIQKSLGLGLDWNGTKMTRLKILHKRGLRFLLQSKINSWESAAVAGAVCWWIHPGKCF